MANTKEERVFVNTPMDPELVEMLDEMVQANESTRAQTIRLLVRRSYDEFQHVRKIGAKVKPQIHEVTHK